MLITHSAKIFELLCPMCHAKIFLFELRMLSALPWQKYSWLNWAKIFLFELCMLSAPPWQNIHSLRSQVKFLKKIRTFPQWFLPFPQWKIFFLILFYCRFGICEPWSGFSAQLVFFFSWKVHKYLINFSEHKFQISGEHFLSPRKARPPS